MSSRFATRPNWPVHPSTTWIRLASGIAGAALTRSHCCCTTPRSARYLPTPTPGCGEKMPSSAGNHAHPGFFLVLDGPDGGGKSTQTGRLADWLRSLGRDVVTCRDPGGTALGERL